MNMRNILIGGGIVLVFIAAATFAYEHQRPTLAGQTWVSKTGSRQTFGTTTADTSTPAQPNSHTTRLVHQTNTYTNSQYGFALDYSSDLRLQAPPTQPLGGWEYTFGHPNQLIAYIPTIGSNNVGEGSISINVSTSSADVIHCLVPSQDPTAQVSTTTINSIQFLRFKYVPDMAGLIQSATYYMTIHEDACYGIVELHENILKGEKGNTLTASETAEAEADESQISATLDPIVQTFWFTK